MAKKLKVKTKEERIQEYLTELLDIFSVLDENKFTLVKPHIEQIAYMMVQLEELQGMIDETGLVERYQNGENQFGRVGKSWTPLSTAQHRYDNKE